MRWSRAPRRPAESAAALLVLLAPVAALAGAAPATAQAPPATTLLYQNFPNPFPRQDLGTATTAIWFDLARAGRVTLTVHDLSGRLVRRLIPGPGCAVVTLPADRYGRSDSPDPGPCASTRWDGLDDEGTPVPPGVYLLRLATSDGQQTRRVLYLPR